VQRSNRAMDAAWESMIHAKALDIFKKQSTRIMHFNANEKHSKKYKRG
jgi:hypothetical protein